MRRATPADLDDIFALEAAAGYSSWSQQQLSDALNNHILFVQESTQGITAYAVFSTVLDEAELLNIVVSPTARQQGLGASLLVEGLKNLSQTGVSRCFLEVGVDNTAAIRLYEKLAFESAGRRKNYYRKGDQSIDALIYVKQLTS